MYDDMTLFFETFVESTADTIDQFVHHARGGETFTIRIYHDRTLDDHKNFILTPIRGVLTILSSGVTYTKQRVKLLIRQLLSQYDTPVHMNPHVNITVLRNGLHHHNYEADHNGVLRPTSFRITHTPVTQSPLERWQEWQQQQQHAVPHAQPIASVTTTNSFGPIPSYQYVAPVVVRSPFTSSVKTGSRSLRSSNYTGSGSRKKLRNGILMTELENTASSSKPTRMVYVKNDPTQLLAPMESWKQLPGQIHPLTRKPLGRSNLRKAKKES